MTPDGTVRHESSTAAHALLARGLDSAVPITRKGLRVRDPQALTCSDLGVRIAGGIVVERTPAHDLLAIDR
jgi:hypothetical protein